MIFAALVFASGVLITSVVKTTAKTALKVPLTGQVTPTPTPEVSGPAKIDYYLPYPGILPDHFLYPLKMIRDRIWLFLTVDPVKEAELLLLFADKRLGAGQALIGGGKVELGISTLTKAEKYLERAIVQAQKAKQQGKETQTLSEKLAKAALKHQEVLGEILPKVSEGNQSVIKNILEYSQKGYQKVSGETTPPETPVPTGE